MSIDIHQVFRELTQHHHLGTPYIEQRGNGEQWTRTHWIEAAPLLEQLATAKPASSDEGGTTGKPCSRPAAWLEQLDTLVAIEREAAYLLRVNLNADDTGHALQVVARLYALRAGIPAKSLDRATIDAYARRWWNQARILTGHDTSAFRPNNTCPLCSERGTLRIRRDATAALCIGCRETWGPEAIGLLAEHIRDENHDTEEQTA